MTMRHMTNEKERIMLEISPCQQQDWLFAQFDGFFPSVASFEKTTARKHLQKSLSALLTWSSFARKGEETRYASDLHMRMIILEVS